MEHNKDTLVQLIDTYVIWGSICVRPGRNVSVVAAPIGTQHSSVCPNKAMETAADTLPSRLPGLRQITGHCLCV